MGAHTDLTEAQIQARAMPRNTPEETVVRKRAMLRANDEKYRKKNPFRTFEGAEQYYANYYANNRERILKVHRAYREHKLGIITLAQYDSVRLRDLKKTETPVQPITAPIIFKLDFN